MTKKGLLTICVAVVVAGGAGTAIAASTGALGSTKPTDNTWVQALAKKLGTTPDKLVEALKGVSNDRIDALVAAGTITQAQADKLKARVEATGGFGRHGGFGPGGGPGRRGGFGPGGMGGHGGMGGPGGDPLATTATYLGMTRDDLDAALDGGKALTDVVKEQGKTTDGLKAALLVEAKTHIDALTAATDVQKKAMLDAASARIDDFIANAATPGHGGGPGFGHRGGHGGGWGRGMGHGMGHGPGDALPGMAPGPSVDQLPAPAA